MKLVGEERSGLKEILAANRRVELVSRRRAGTSKAISRHRRQDAGKTARRPAADLQSRRPAISGKLGEAVADPLVTRVEATIAGHGAACGLFDAYLPEARQLQIAESVRAVAKPILWAGATPLGYAIDRAAGPHGGDRRRSGRRAIWPCKPAFPQLMPRPWTGSTGSRRGRTKW